jgi:hypothetical protein
MCGSDRSFVLNERGRGKVSFPVPEEQGAFTGVELAELRPGGEEVSPPSGGPDARRR